MKTSSLFSLNLADLGRGLVVAIGGAVVTLIQNSLASGSLTFDWKAIGGVALAAGLSYLGKNFFTPAKLVTPAE